MPSTFLQLTNKILRRINEVELTETTFASARGVQALAKDAINDTISKINAVKFEWPFNAFEHTITLIPGTNEYAWPTRFKVADWNSFQIQKDDTLNIRSRTLRYINRQEWYKWGRDKDRDSDPDGISIPDYVFESHGTGFGVSPVPNEAYELVFRYYKHPTILSAYDDTSTIPDEFEYVITDGALFHMNMFRENVEATREIKKEFSDNIVTMANILISKPETMQSTMINYGTTRSGSSFLPDS